MIRTEWAAIFILKIIVFNFWSFSRWVLFERRLCWVGRVGAEVATGELSTFFFGNQHTTPLHLTFSFIGRYVLPTVWIGSRFLSSHLPCQKKFVPKFPAECWACLSLSFHFVLVRDKMWGSVCKTFFSFFSRRNYLFNGTEGVGRCGNVLLPVNMFHDRARCFNWNQSIALGVLRTSPFGSAEIGRRARPRTSPEEASVVGGWFADEWMSGSFWTQNLSVRTVHRLSNGVQHDGTLCAVSRRKWNSFVRSSTSTLDIDLLRVDGEFFGLRDANAIPKESTIELNAREAFQQRNRFF